MLPGAIEGDNNIDNEVRQAQEVFISKRIPEWLEWAGEVLMVEFAREVEAERAAEESKRREEEAKRIAEEQERARAAAEEEKRRRREEEMQRREIERLRKEEEIRKQKEAEEQRRTEVEEKTKAKLLELAMGFGEGRISLEEYTKRAAELEKEKAEELGEGESEKEDDEKGEEGKKVEGKVFVEVPPRRGRGRPKRSLLDFPETDAEDLGNEVENLEKDKMVS
jgi:hypothetical protein